MSRTVFCGLDWGIAGDKTITFTWSSFAWQWQATFDLVALQTHLALFCNTVTTSYSRRKWTWLYRTDAETETLSHSQQVQNKSHSLQLDQTSSPDWVGIYRQWLIDIYITPLYSVVVLEQRFTGTCVGLNCWEPLQPRSATFMFCLHTCTVAAHQHGGAPPVEDTVKVDHLSRTHCDVSHLFVDYLLKALCLACWRYHFGSL